VPKEHLFPCTNCGMAPMDRDIALAKLKALAEGAALARKKLANRGKSAKSKKKSKKKR
jgi:5-methyltetrahydropteroyltriglutamate--homocysteine methyltransferase